ncbi:iron-containing alcohol dehydrogenase [Marinigracilibium pacificum]|uniref:Iron-containing alcohol dehydrogenase n=1 Tax=Marinigracilibium pacificum TaxID=2729599 RepID=A0A848J2B4_9BACT|nr:iron-containing alcohol dehydrogenase [Marinigracilibium pacificum]NMM49861.1 iron-containing alcohol dehydrogenase [Marinigracilibium pacificum]
MNNFEFYNPVKIIFGKDQISKLPNHIPTSSRIMITYGGGSIKKNGVYDQVIKALEGHFIVEFGGIEPNPHYETAMKAVELARENQIDFILAVGGGSVIDATKFIAAAIPFNDGDPWTILSEKKPVKSAISFGSILTLPATGSEMNSGSVITKVETKEKLAFGSPFTFPQFSILDPTVASTLPQRQVANGVVDAFTHVVEQYMTYKVDAPLQDRLAESILLTLIEEGPKAYEDPSNYDAMANLMWCATMALNGIIRAGVPVDWATHGIGHELTALHGIDHARTLAIVLPGVWRVLKEEKKDKLIQYAERIWNITEGSENEKIDKAIEATERFFESLGIKTKMKDYNVGTDTIDTIVDRFEKRGWTALGDRQLADIPTIKEILNTQLQ